MGFTNPLTGPIVVAGGTIDSVANVTGDVLGNLHGSAGSVAGNVAGSTASVTGAVGSVTGNVLGSVASVLGSVASVLGSVASVTGAVGSVTGNVTGSVASVTGAVGSVTGNVTGSVASVTGAVGSVAGNVTGNVAGSVASVLGSVASVIGNVAGSVASVAGNVAGTVGGVTGNVTPDPAASIAAVTSNVPILGRDYFYWPGISGEQMPPVLASSMAYQQRDDLPAYSNQGISSATATFQQMPRRNPVGGKSNAQVSFQAWFGSNGAANYSSFFRWGQMIDLALGTAGAFHMFSGSGSVAQVTANAFMPLNQWVAFVVTVSAAGVIDVYVNGNLTFHVTAPANALWPTTVHSSGDVKPVFLAPNAGQHYFSQLQITWS